ncbi:hypothetical protein F5148DRAFT_1278893 [Russula earlei]|uniref:Uncharacterized protein n=1 Tax=Russula earlei TaxID=71964 RepID=A0ACC0UPV2_9AGAM|nr:hypothetical protein F5148DRAFT_1278893 [Russula earlei]
MPALTQEEVTQINADSSNWTWTPDRWDTAPGEWMAFAEGARKFQPEAGVFDLGPFASIHNTTVFVRECYREAEKVVWQQAVNLPRDGIIFTGQPGIGKTYFVWYLLIRLLQDNQTIVFVVDGESPILFYLDGIYVPKDPLYEEYLPHLPKNSRGGFVWFLFDISSPCSPIPSMVYSPSPLFFPIQAPSPNPAHYSIWHKFRRPLYTAFPIWTFEELKKGLLLDRRFENFKSRLEQYLGSWHDTLSPRPTDAHPINFHFEHIRSLHGVNPPRIEEAIDDILNNVVSYFGYVPRDIFRAVLSNFQDIHNDVMDALHDKPEDLDSMLCMVMQRDKLSLNQSSHCLIVITPRHEIGLPVEWDVDFRTVWVGRAVALKFKEYEEQSRAILASWLFEAYAHRKIVGADVKPLREPLRGLRYHSDPPRFVFQLAGSSQSSSPLPWSVVKQVEFSVLPKNFLPNVYYTPSAPNFPLIDAFIITHDDNQIFTHLWVLQMTTSKKHLPKGYDKIGEIIDTLLPQPEDTNAGHRAILRPTQPSSCLPDSSPPRKKMKAAASSSTGQFSTIKVHHVLVCPQDPPGSNEMCEWILPKGWNDNIGADRYLLEIPLNVRPLPSSGFALAHVNQTCFTDVF